MTPSKKPDWFEISENDKSSDVRRVTKRYPLLALLATVVILGVGAVVAQTQEEEPAIAVLSATPSPRVTESIPPAVNPPSISKPQTIPEMDDVEVGERHESGERRERGDHREFGDDD
jgi:hypothetical protein